VNSMVSWTATSTRTSRFGKDRPVRRAIVRQIDPSGNDFVDKIVLI
jgi:hypothetical protein